MIIIVYRCYITSRVLPWYNRFAPKKNRNSNNFIHIEIGLEFEFTLKIRNQLKCGPKFYQKMNFKKGFCDFIF